MRSLALNAKTPSGHHSQFSVLSSPFLAHCRRIREECLWTGAAIALEWIVNIGPLSLGPVHGMVEAGARWGGQRDRASRRETIGRRGGSWDGEAGLGTFQACRTTPRAWW